MLDFKETIINYNVEELFHIEHRLDQTGYVEIQFNIDDLPKNDDDFLLAVEHFFVNFIESIGGECLKHNKDHDSIVWHVRPIDMSTNRKMMSLARSQTDEEFAFHTDCSYEMNPPEYMALFVLETDRLNGGHLEIIQLSDILKQLSDENKTDLMKNHFRIEIPKEFRKSADIDHINGSILLDNERIRYRSDIMSGGNMNSLNELNSIINRIERYRPKLEQFTMIILNNYKYLHARTKILDHRRHLLRIRFDRPNYKNVYSIYDQSKLRPEYLNFSNQFYEYFQEKHKNLYDICHSIIDRYGDPTAIGQEIQQTFNFHPRIHHLLQQVKVHRSKFSLDSYRPDVILAHGNSFLINGKHKFQPKICEINARFAFNGYFLSQNLCSHDKQNRLTRNFMNLVEDIIHLAQFDRRKPMFILKDKEKGFDIHLFRHYWINNYSQNCIFITPNRLTIDNGKLIDSHTKLILEQFIFELHQEEIFNLSDEILKLLIEDQQIRYINDIRTIFILHDKRLFSLLSNQSFIYALLNNYSISIQDLIPTTYIIKHLPKYLRNSIEANRQHWCIKPFGSGKGENVTIGLDVTQDYWIKQLSDWNHQDWILQQYVDFIQYDSMNCVGMFVCFADRCYQMGIIRMSPHRIVNICHGGAFARCYIHQQVQHSNDDRSILTKTNLYEKLEKSKLIDSRWNKQIYLSSSGGTNGKSLYFATDIQENRLQREILVELMIEEEILCQDDVCLNVFQSNNIYRSFEIFNDFCSIANCTSIPMGSNAENEKILQSVEYFKPNVLMGTPYRLTQLASFVEKENIQTIQFEKIFFAGEFMDQNKQKYLEEIFHCATFLGFYGSAEVGVFACQPKRYSSTKIYLYPKEIVDLEIVDDNIIVTNLIRKRNQLIRFNTGDQGTMLSNDNDEKYGSFQICHSERLFLIGQYDFAKSNVENMMKKFDFLEWQLIIDYLYHEDRKVYLCFRYALRESSSTNEIEIQLKNELNLIFDGKLETISEKLEYRFESITMNDFIRNQTSNKLLKIVDRRI